MSNDPQMLLKNALHAAHTSITEYNATAETHLRAERDLGTLLTTHPTDAATTPLTRTQITRAKRLASIPTSEFDTYIANTKQRGKLITITDALKLAPRTRTQQRASHAHTYTTPPIDVQLSRAYGLDAADIRADIIDNALHTALRNIKNPRHRHVWMLAHGIHEDGTIGEPWTTSRIATHLAVSTPTAARLLSDARNHILEHLLITAMDQWGRWMTIAKAS